MDLPHKSHNTQVLYPPMRYFVTDYGTMCIFLLQSCAFWDISLTHCEICETESDGNISLFCNSLQVIWFITVTS